MADDDTKQMGRKQKLGIGFAVTWTVLPTAMVFAGKMQGMEWKTAVALTAMPVVMGLLGFAAWKDRA